MRRTFLAFALLIFAGCTEPNTTGPPSSGGEVDAITPGQWHVNGPTDHLLFWAHNGGDSDMAGEWRISMADGSAVPPGWNITFSEATVMLKPDGTKVQSGRGYTYPDWDWTLATVRLTENASHGVFSMRVDVGSLSQLLVVGVEENRTDVSGPGSSVNAKYAGSFKDNGEEFDSGAFPTTLGSGQTVPGFDYGLMGLAVGEEASLHVPPALGYGYDNPPGRYADFNGRWMVFDVELTSIG